MWMGGASSVKLNISHISVALRAGVSVMASSQPLCTGVPLTIVPRSAARGPTPGRVAESTSFSDTCRVTVAEPSGVNAGRVSWCGGTLVSVEASGATTNFMTWPVVAGSAAGKSLSGTPPPPRGGPGGGGGGGQAPPRGADLPEGESRAGGPAGQRLGDDLQDQEPRGGAGEGPQPGAAGPHPAARPP